MIDLNVLLDVFQRREPFYETSAQALSRIVCLLIVTRNVKDFSGSPIPASSPAELMATPSLPRVEK